jgi:nucleotide-binding universal stress UspA family protein
MAAAREHGATLTLAGPPGRRLDRLLEVAGLLGERVEVTHLPRDTSPVGAAAGYDLVVMVGRVGRSGWWGAGPLERELIRGCGCPVWIVHPAQGPELRVVMGAVDVPDEEAGVSPSRAALRVAGELASTVDAQLHVVHCWSVLGETLLASRSRGGSPKGARRVAATRVRSRRARLQRLLEEEGLATRAGLLLQKDSVVPGLRESAWRLEADVVVIGTAGRTGLAGLIPGNLAERVVGRIPASVVVVPAGESEGAAAGASGRPGRPGPTRGAA